MVTRNRIHVYIETYCDAEPCTASCNSHFMKIGRVVTAVYARQMIYKHTDRQTQTDVHSHHNTSLSYRNFKLSNTSIMLQLLIAKRFSTRRSVVQRKRPIVTRRIPCLFYYVIDNERVLWKNG